MAQLTTAGADEPQVAGEDFARSLADLNLKGLWTIPEVSEPSTPVEPFVWRWETLKEQLTRAPQHVDVDDVERLALLLVNPGLKGRGLTTHTLGADLQMLRPGDVAEGHRHSFSAIRFVVQGQGAHTIVNGEKVMMSPGDLILTPSWTWHEHGNASDDAVIWFDGLDTLTRQLGAYFKEWADGPQEVEFSPGYSVHRYDGQTRPFGYREQPVHSPQRLYPWDRTSDALDRLETIGEISPFDDVALEYTNPLNGSHVLPIIGCAIQRIRPGVQTQAHRHTSSSVYQVFRGSGYSIVDGNRLEWSQGDCFALPSWAVHEHGNNSDKDEAVLFSISDRPTMEALHLYREQAAESLTQRP